MTTTAEKTIGQMVAEDYRAAAIFKKYNIDFCCNGNRGIDEACTAKSIDANQLKLELNNLQNTGTGDADYNSWPLDLLIDYIEKKHHRYVETAIGEIKPFLQKICAVHGEKHPDLYQVKDLFFEGAGELTQHMKKEELILFPFVRKMTNLHLSDTTTGMPHFGTVQNPIKMMMQEHDTEGARFRTINELTNNYTVPEDGCATYRVTLQMLEAFENDLHKHIHLENNILFPKALSLENNLLGKY
jgi:regulator of cell morphogenesis and NO signaling